MADNVHPFPGSSDKRWSLPLIDVTEWIGREPPQRQWIVDGWLARGTGALLVGEDGVGKSLLAQQLATCIATGRSLLGLDVVQAPAVYVSCEDGEDEMWRRQRAINRAIGTPLDAAPAMLSSLAGSTDVALGYFDEYGRFQLGPVFDGLRDLALERRPGLIVLDNVAHFFPGNENARREVASFCSALDRLAIEANAAVLALAHPSKGGAEYSGSTGWSAHVRQRWWLERPEDALDRDQRLLRKSKSNYAESGSEVTFRWHSWAFVRDADLPPDVAAEMAVTIQATAENDRFMKCLAKATEERRATSPSRAASNYAPRLFAKMTIGRGITEAGFEGAMERLLHLGTIRGDQRVYQRENRTWALGLACTNRCTNHAQSGAQSLHEAARSNSTDPHMHVTLGTTYLSGAATEAAAPNPEENVDNDPAA